jgi:hypothetical protein
VQAYLIMAAAGVLSGIAVTFVRTPMGMPGHKVLLWMIPVLAARLKTGARAGASAGAFASAGTMLSLGGRIAGGGLMLPAIVAAGAILDLAVTFAHRRAMSAGGTLIVLAASGMAGNLVCFANWAAIARGAVFTHGSSSELAAAALSYAFFGILAGFMGGIAGLTLLRPWQRRRAWI